MKQTREKYDAKFKGKVAIEALTERETLNELAAKYELSPRNQPYSTKQALHSSGNLVLTKNNTVPV